MEHYRSHLEATEEQYLGSDNSTPPALGEQATGECAEIIYGPHLDEVPATVRLESFVLFGFDPGDELFDPRDVKQALRNVAGSPELKDKTVLQRFQNLSLDAANLSGQLDVNDNGTIMSPETSPHPVHRALNQRSNFVGACTPGTAASVEDTRRLMDMFYPNGKQKGYEKKVEDAKAICATCGVRQQCLDFAMGQPASKDQGVMGGTSDGERRRARRIARTKGQDAADKYLQSITDSLPKT